MKLLRFTLIALTSLIFISCSNLQPERKPVPPQGSGFGDQAWNTPRQGEGEGGFGGLLQGN